MLLVALMRARGIAADPVLINFGNSYTLPGAPVIGAFTHCITYLPEWDIYADTTAGGAPFGTLPFQDYGKPVVQAVLQGDAAGSGQHVAQHKNAARSGGRGNRREHHYRDRALCDGTARHCVPRAGYRHKAFCR
jgi:hypothetical protein